LVWGFLRFNTGLFFSAAPLGQHRITILRYTIETFPESNVSQMRCTVLKADEFKALAKKNDRGVRSNFALLGTKLNIWNVVSVESEARFATQLSVFHQKIPLLKSK
jgi:hypothetical protein